MPNAQKLIKSASHVLAAIVLAIAVLIVAVSLFGSRVARVAIENAGAKAFRTAVSIQTTKLSVLGGSLNLQGLTIDNPPGYRHKTFLQLTRGDMQVKMTGLLGNELTIHDLRFDGLDVILEPGDTGSNLQDIIDALHQAPPFGKRLYVDHLEITNITVNVSLSSAAGQTGLVPVKLSPITMTDLGRNERLDASKLSHKILTALAINVAQQSGQLLPEQVIGGLGDVLGTALGLGRNLLGNPNLSGPNDPNEPAKPALRIP